MHGHPLSANETTILAATISAIISLVVWFLTQRFGPNYKKQIGDLTETLKEILQQHSAIAETLASVSARSQSNWRPSARIESEPRENRLVLKSDREFKVEKIAFLAANGAVISEIQQKEWEDVRTTGYRLLLPQDKITQLWNDSLGPRNGWATGTIKVQVSRDERTVDLSLPFMAKQDFVSQGSAIYAWIKLTG
jgi:hypothetical protein